MCMRRSRVDMGNTKVRLAVLKRISGEDGLDECAVYCCAGLFDLVGKRKGGVWQRNMPHAIEG